MRIHDDDHPEGIWRGVVGQHEAVAVLRAAADAPTHAYLFSGPPGTGKRAAARAFAAALLAGPGASPDHRAARLALSGQHPDVREVTRSGAAISAEQAAEIVRVAALAPAEAARKVLIAEDFHLIRPEAAARLLKTIEEPPPSTVFVILTEQVTPELVTIASRCLRVEFRPLLVPTIVAQLEREGVPADVATQAAAVSGGNLGRARLLAADPQLAHRRQRFAAVPTELDGSGSAVVRLVDQLLGAIDAAAEPLKQRQAEEIAELEERVAASGERGAGRKALEERHKREARRHRTDELRAGLGEITTRYRDELVTGSAAHPGELIAAVERIHVALEALERNPNEALLLVGLLLRLPSL